MYYNVCMYVCMYVDGVLSDQEDVAVLLEQVREKILIKIRFIEKSRKLDKELVGYYRMISMYVCMYVCMYVFKILSLCTYICMYVCMYGKFMYVCMIYLFIFFNLPT